jgi:azurin
MKTANKISATLFTLTVVVLGSLAYKPMAHSSVINQASDLQAVTVTAHRMNAVQKTEFDREQNSVQTVVVSAKVMTAAQKAAYDRANGI